MARLYVVVLWAGNVKIQFYVYKTLIINHYPPYKIPSNFPHFYWNFLFIFAPIINLKN